MEYGEIVFVRDKKHIVGGALQETAMFDEFEFK